MQGSLKIRQLIFDEQGLMFVIQRLVDGEYFHCRVLELFSNDQLLGEFDLPDIRLICYFAAVDEYQLDQTFLKKVRRIEHIV